jgi:hypothetical protein
MFSPMLLRSLLEVMLVADPHLERSPQHEELYQKLFDEVGIASWDALAPHADRGSLFWVDQTLDIVEVGVSLAADDTLSVKAWHEAELLLLAAPQTPKDFAAYRFLIIQPFVIASPLDLTELIESGS